MPPMIARLLGVRGVICAGAAGLAVGFSSGWKVRDVLADATEARRALRDSEAQVRAAQDVLRRMQGASAINAEVGGRSAQRQVAIRTVTQDIVREVPRYVTIESDAGCSVPTGFVRLHDNAAAGRSPSAAIPDSAAAPHDAPSGIALSAVAATLAGNYGTCREDAERLGALQEWIRAQAVLAAQ